MRSEADVGFRFDCGLDVLKLRMERRPILALGGAAALACDGRCRRQWDVVDDEDSVGSSISSLPLRVLPLLDLLGLVEGNFQLPHHPGVFSAATILLI